MLTRCFGYMGGLKYYFCLNSSFRLVEFLISFQKKPLQQGLQEANHLEGAFQGAFVVKNLSASAEDVRDTGLIPGLGRCPGGGRGNPLQYSCPENSTDRGTWCAIVHGWGCKELGMADVT